MEKYYIPDKETLAKAKKDVKEKKKVKVKKKKRAEEKTAEKNKKIKAEVVKEKKRIEVETIAWKKIEDKADKNVKTSLQKNKLVNIKRHYSTALLEKKSNKSQKTLHK